MTRNNLEKILNQPAYWVEAINGTLYNAIVEYMKKNNLNRTQLAQFLGISKGRVSQILNDGRINFSIEKIVEIALKIGKFPAFELDDSASYLNKLEKFNTKKSELAENNRRISRAVTSMKKSNKHAVN